jgi:AcrR family transcriptional regulator
VYNWITMTTDPHATPGKRAAQGRATHDLLVEAATRLFAEQGYEDTSIEDVLDQTGVSRGAIYHHFAGKEALFVAALEQVEATVMSELGAKLASAPSAADALKTVSLGWLKTAGDPRVSRIMLIDAPAVLGWQRWRHAGGQALGEMRQLLQAVADEGRLAPALVNPYAHMLMAALDELALMIAEADDKPAAIAESHAAIEDALGRLID